MWLSCRPPAPTAITARMRHRSTSWRMRWTRAEGIRGDDVRRRLDGSGDEEGRRLRPQQEEAAAGQHLRQRAIIVIPVIAAAADLEEADKRRAATDTGPRRRRVVSGRQRPVVGDGQRAASERRQW
uniref:Uncharacterized protein n=1 Tax=Oryza barthii TaxID=65489 RepID=A0A0D3HVI1_9ORYZ